MFSSFLSVGKMPDAWRSAIVTLIYKGGLASDVSNYRPILLTSVFSKVMERIVVAEMSRYMLANGVITKHQHGFLCKRSTTTKLTETLSDWIVALNNRQSVSVAYIDFTKAFDLVCLRKLLLKLHAYGIELRNLIIVDPKCFS